MDPEPNVVLTSSGFSPRKTSGILKPSFRTFREHLMSVTIKALGLEKLSPAERIQLARELWDSVSALPDLSLLTDAHRADLQRRLDEYRDNPLAGSPWEEVMARILKGEP